MATKRPLTIEPAIMTFPARVWELSSNGGWTSRPEKKDDREARIQLANRLDCIPHFSGKGDQ